MKIFKLPLLIVLPLVLGCSGGEGTDNAQLSRPKADIKHAGYQAEELFEAIQDGDTEEVADLIEERSDIDAKNDAGMTPLMMAVNSNKRNIARLLTDSSANLEERNDQGQTALMIASSPGIDEVDQMEGNFFNSVELYGTSEVKPADTVAVLLKAGANPNTRDDSGATALMYAYDLKKVRLLLRHGALADAVDQAGRTALMLAALNCWSDKLDVLTAHGANKALRDKRGKTASDLVREYQVAARDRIRTLSNAGGSRAFESVQEEAELSRTLDCMEKKNVLGRIR